MNANNITIAEGISPAHSQMSAEIDRIISLSEGQYRAEEARLRELEQAAYAGYNGTISTPQEGSPQTAGHGSFVSGFTGQAEWHAARASLDEFRRIRTDARYWNRVPAEQHDEAAWEYTGAPRRHVVRVVTHGANPDEFVTPAAFIAAIRESLAA